MNAPFFHNEVIHSILIINCVVFTNANIFGFMKFNPHLHLTTPQVVKLHGYPVETHTVQSEGGFLLKLHRIPHGRSSKSKNSNRYPLLLCHELLGSSFDWVLSGPEKSLGFKLPDEGYDVWLLNIRGNVYSYRNVKFTQIQYEYWDFTFHDEGIYDITASIDYILNVTCREKLIVIGHSMGNTAFYVMASMLPEYNHKVEAQISLAPVAAIPHSTTALLLLYLFVVPIIIITKTFFSGAFLTRNRFVNLFFNLLCNYLTKELCFAVLVAPIFGLDPFQFDRNLIPPYFAHVPAGTSIKNLRHFGQTALPGGGFRQFDYGVLGNLANYGMPIAPAYNLSNIQVPIRAYYGDTDVLAKPIDSRAFYREIPKPLGLIRVNSITFNHIDFLGATDINPLVNDDVINFLNNITDRADGSKFLNDTIRHSIKHRKRNIHS